MRISDMNWMMLGISQAGRSLCAPLGSTEQHAYLSLSVDSILAERIAVEVRNLWAFPSFRGGFGSRRFFARSRLDYVTGGYYLRVVGDILDAMAEQGSTDPDCQRAWRQCARASLLSEWMRSSRCSDQISPIVGAPKTWAQVMAIDCRLTRLGMENFHGRGWLT